MTIMKWVFMFQSDKECCKNLREFGSFLRVYRVLQFFSFFCFFLVLLRPGKVSTVKLQRAVARQKLDWWGHLTFATAPRAVAAVLTCFTSC